MLYSATGWGLLYFEYFKQRIEFKTRHKVTTGEVKQKQRLHIFSQRPFIFTVLALAAACMRRHLKLFVLLSIKVAERTHQL